MKVVGSHLQIGDLLLEESGGEPASWLLTLFSDDEYEVYVPGEEEKIARKWPQHHWHELSLHRMTTTAGIIADRLDLAGFTPARVNSVLTAYTKYQASWQANHDFLASYRNLSAWSAAFSVALGSPELRNASLLDMQPGSLIYLMAVWNDSNRQVWEGADRRLMLRAVTQSVDRDTPLSLELTMVESSENHDRPRNRRTALEYVAADFRIQAPVIVLTEGSTDTSILELALTVIYPHLVDFIRFLDYRRRNRPETNAGALLQTVKSFSAAGLGNRVVAIFDNDAAATDVLESLNLAEVAPNVRVLQYPSIDLARRYPAFEAGGEIMRADINGLAGSIELYLGRDVLTRDRELAPVMWGGYVGKKRRRQGEITGKRDLQRRFKVKAHQTLDGTRVMDWENWTEMKQILDTIRTAFDD